uniref:Uncharacterized protein n=1 Tax=Globodera rostochiensis TaxID=31243 RepID=A0A914IBE5_GLORO
MRPENALRKQGMDSGDEGNKSMNESVMQGSEELWTVKRVKCLLTIPDNPTTPSHGESFSIPFKAMDDLRKPYNSNRERLC